MDEELGAPVQALAVRPAMSLDHTMRIAKVLAESGFFRDAPTMAKAAAKILLGAELGVSPMVAMQSVFVIEGKTSLSAGLMAGLIQAHPRYGYRVVESTPQVARIEFIDNGTVLGVQSFSIAQAQQAGLTGKDNWKKFPEAMLFSRAMSAGARKFVPAVFLGSAVYTPDEIAPDLQVDPATGEVIDGRYSEVADDSGNQGITEEQMVQIRALFGALKMNAPARSGFLQALGYPAMSELTETQAGDVCHRLQMLLMAAHPETLPEYVPPALAPMDAPISEQVADAAVWPNPSAPLTPQLT